MSNKETVNYRCHEKCCLTCRYFRMGTRPAWVSDCLLLGEMVGIVSELNPGSQSQLADWARGGVCDQWKRRPKTWQIITHGSEKCPFWHDPYIPRETQLRLAKRLGLKRG